MIDVTNLSTAELLELKEQVKERLNSFASSLESEKSLDELIDLFNRRCIDKDLCLGMKKIETKDGIVLQIDDAFDVIYESEPENEETIRSLIKEHISYIRVYRYLTDLEIDEYKFIQFDDSYVIIDFEYQNVNFRLREDLSLDNLTLSASIVISDRGCQKTLNVDDMILRVSSENYSDVKVELHDSQEIVADELQDKIESMSEKILDKSLSFSTF